MFIPENGGVYIILRNDNVPGSYTNVYVGKTNNLRSRFIEHLADSELNIQLKNNIRNTECYFRYLILSTEQERTNKEIELLRTFSWECNQKMES